MTYVKDSTAKVRGLVIIRDKGINYSKFKHELYGLVEGDIDEDDIIEHYNAYAMCCYIQFKSVSDWAKDYMSGLNENHIYRLKTHNP